MDEWMDGWMDGWIIHNTEVLCVVSRSQVSVQRPGSTDCHRHTESISTEAAARCTSC